MKAHSILSQILLDTSFILACVTALAYLVGISYYDGFIRNWDLEVSLFPIGFENTLTYGFVVIFPVAFRSSFYVAFLIAAVFLTIIGMQLLNKLEWYCKFKNRVLNLVLVAADTKPEVGLLKQGEEITQQLLIRSGALVIILLSIGLLLVHADNRGKMDADKQREDFKTTLVSEFKILRHRAVIKGHIIQCSDSKCALYVDKNILVIKLDDIEQIQTTKPD